MPGSTEWTKGWGDEYDLVGQVLNAATPEQHQRFIDGVRGLGEGLMEAHTTAYFGGRTPLRDVERNWFGIGGDPQWLWDCSLTPEQIHEVMKETRARTAELLVQHPDWEIELWVKCGHARFRTTITWPSAETPEDKVVRCWVQMPFNSGYNPAISAPMQSAVALRDGIVARVDGGTPVEEAMRIDDLRNISYGFPAGELIWPGSPLCRKSGGPLSGTTLAVKPLVAVTEPIPPVLLPPPDPKSHAIPSRVVAGIEISWYGAGGSRLRDANGDTNPIYD